MTNIESLRLITEAVETAGTDIAPSYAEYVQLAFAIATDCGEAGREFFHAVSSVYPGYDRAKTDTKYTNLLRTTRKVTIATFFYQCEVHGITLDRND